MIRRDEKMIQRSELAVNQARKEYYPDVTLNGGYYNMGLMAPMFEAKVDFNLPYFTRGRQRAMVAEQALRMIFGAPPLSYSIPSYLRGQVSRQEAIEEIGIDWVDLAERQQQAVLEDMEWALTPPDKQ